MLMCKVSILVPVYKVEKYLARCIDSVLKQDFHEWEMILVNDGSPDNSPKICDEYAQKDKRIKVIHKSNGGLLSARQAGVKVAKGKYLVFWDSDDTVPLNALSVLYNNIISEDFDIVKGKGMRINKKGEVEELEPYRFSEGIIESSEDFIYKIFVGDLSPYLWNGIYKKELFYDKFYEEAINNHISVGEDWVTNLIIGKKIKRVKVIKDIVYYYYYNPTSMMGSSIFSNEYQARIDKVLYLNGIFNIKSITKIAEIKLVCGLIRNSFIPELKYSQQNYDKIKTVISDKNKFNSIKKFTNRKFTLFIKYRYIFYFYTRIYCIFFQIIRLHGKKRKVLN